jgi:hypothetical protein
MFPHERSLVKKLEGKPFVLLGVNGDDDDPKLKEKNSKQQITWRSFKNARTGKSSLADEWNIDAWPTLFLVDHHGIIRNRWEGSPGEKELEAAIDQLIAETEKSPAK